MAELHDADFGRDGHCVCCHLSSQAIERLDQLLIARKAESLAINPICGHTMAYRSLGLWTAIMQHPTTRRSPR